MLRCGVVAWPACYGTLFVLVACAAGGKGRPRPLHPRPMGVCPLEPQIDVIAQQLSGAHGSGMLRLDVWPVWLGIPEP
jgi:hypothetical protein